MKASRAGSDAKDGAPGRARTYNLRIRSPTLYPIELQAQHISTIFTRKWLKKL